MYILRSLASIYDAATLADSFYELQIALVAARITGDQRSVTVIENMSDTIASELAEITRIVDGVDIGQRYTRWIKGGKLKG